jgi:predicted dehydrogenase
MAGVRESLRIEAIHEIDPSLIPRNRRGSTTWDTSPYPSPSDHYDAFLIAGFHHTHAPIAVRAVELGSAAVVEKPIATSRSQLSHLLATLARQGGRFFAGYHKRYSPLTQLALQDLRQSEESAINYSAIVFEEPLPLRHWYRWPNSRSRIVSNACHWLDHFLYLNGFSRPTGLNVVRGASDGETVSITVQLENGAFMSLAMSDVGSARRGVTDHIELRAGGRTVSISNGSEYVAEDGDRVLRRVRVNKMTSYEQMYRRIASSIAKEEPGDSLESIDVSSGLVLDTEDAFLSTPLKMTVR